MPNQNQLRLGRTRFPALGVGHMYLLQVLIWFIVFYDTQLKTTLRPVWFLFSFVSDYDNEHET